MQFYIKKLISLLLVKLGFAKPVMIYFQCFDGIFSYAVIRINKYPLGISKVIGENGISFTYWAHNSGLVVSNGGHYVFATFKKGFILINTDFKNETLNVNPIGFVLYKHQRKIVKYADLVDKVDGKLVFKEGEHKFKPDHTDAQWSGVTYLPAQKQYPDYPNKIFETVIKKVL